MSTIVIEFDPTLEDLFMNSGFIAVRIRSDRMEGAQEVVAALVALSSVTLPIIGKVVIEALRSKRRIEIKAKGLTVSGLSEATAMQILERLLVND